MLKIYIDFWDLSTITQGNQTKDCYYSKISKRIASLSGVPTVNIYRRDSEKPRVLYPQGWYFNLSHSVDIVCCGYSNTEIGLDLEYHKMRDFISVAKFWFHQEEYAHVRSGMDILDFYNIWTKKEAWIKMKGKSIWEMKDAPNMMADYPNSRCFSLKWKKLSLSLSFYLDNPKEQEIEMILSPDSPKLTPEIVRACPRTRL